MPWVLVGHSRCSGGNAKAPGLCGRDPSGGDLTSPERPTLSRRSVQESRTRQENGSPGLQLHPPDPKNQRATEILDAIRANLLSSAVLFFALGLIAALTKSDLKFPESFYTALTIHLLVAIGFKGGVAIAEAGWAGCSSRRWWPWCWAARARSVRARRRIRLSVKAIADRAEAVEVSDYAARSGAAQAQNFGSLADKLRGALEPRKE